MTDRERLLRRLGGEVTDRIPVSPFIHINYLLSDAVETLGGSAMLAGGIDQLDLLRKGSTQEIRGAVKQALETVGDRCPYVLGTTDYFNEDTPEEKIRVMAEAGREYGRV